MAVWVVRGLGTAIMHGGVAALFAIISQTLTERQMRINPLYYLPGYAVAVIVHSVFNHFLVAPVPQAVGTLLILPPLLHVVFQRSARAKAAMMARENGIELPVGERTREKFEELRFLEKSIGKTGCLAMKPFLLMERKVLWRMHVIDH